MDSKITQEQASYITKECISKWSDNTDGETRLIEEYCFETSEEVKNKWGWISVAVNFNIAVDEIESGGDRETPPDVTTYIDIEFDYIGITTNIQDLDDGVSSIEMHGKECKACNLKDTL
jgi:hypothetical protein